MWSFSVHDAIPPGGVHCAAHATTPKVFECSCPCGWQFFTRGEPVGNTAFAAASHHAMTCPIARGWIAAVVGEWPVMSPSWAIATGRPPVPLIPNLRLGRMWSTDFTPFTIGDFN